jgi:hypothetical protein
MSGISGMLIDLLPLEKTRSREGPTKAIVDLFLHGACAAKLGLRVTSIQS